MNRYRGSLRVLGALLVGACANPTAMFVAAGQAGYMTTASGKEAVVAVYALNGTYRTVAEGLDQDLPNTEKVLNQIQRAS